MVTFSTFTILFDAPQIIFTILSTKGQTRTHLNDDSEADLRWLGSKPPLEVPVVINEDIFCEINVTKIKISLNNY